MTRPAAASLHDPPTGSRPGAVRMRVAMLGWWGLLLACVVIALPGIARASNTCFMLEAPLAAPGVPAPVMNGRDAARAASCARTVAAPGVVRASMLPSSRAAIDVAGSGGMARCAEDGDCDCPCRESCACIARHPSVVPAAAPPIAALLLVQPAARLRAPPPRVPRGTPREPALRPPIA